ncbi:phage protein NinX family protein [Providencia rettgeri]|uniref:phage protein NinX family protein n=1 Tax=Providencia rettgeri TaxID=587 RepID=UPI0032DA513A
MNKYTELSDFEINKLVAISIGFSCYYGDGSYTNGLGSSAAIVKGKNHHGNFRLGEFDPCNNPADAMPIIIENKIAMNHPYDIWQCGSGWNVAENKNPLRACMESYLLMKDAENEG